MYSFHYLNLCFAGGSTLGKSGNSFGNKHHEIWLLKVVLVIYLCHGLNAFAKVVMF